MKLTFKTMHLELKDTFTISNHSRKSTPIVLTGLSHDVFTGYGEASMPPYLGETHESVVKFLSKLDLSRFKDPTDIDPIMEYVDNVDMGNNAAKACVDIALHDLAGKILNKPVSEIFGLTPKILPTSITIGITDSEGIRAKVNEYDNFQIIKVKLGSENDRETIDTIREITDKPIYVDVNQGWKDKIYAAEMIDWLTERGVALVEQPMPVNMIDETSFLTESSKIPIIADESIKRFEGLKKVKGIFSGINIKLMKSTGLHEAFKMCKEAKSLGLKIMLGCMTETSCGISAAAQLSPLADYLDLDGNLLIKDDPFVGVKASDGLIKLNYKPGIGVDKVTVR